MTREANALQGTGAWFNARTGKLTASRMAAAMAFLKAKKDEAPKESSERRKLKIEILAERLTGNIVPKYVTHEMQWGIDQEPMAKEAFTIATGMQVTDVGFVEHPSIENCGSSPDGIIESQVALLEIKCPSTSTMISWLIAANENPDWLPDDYLPQMALQSACLGGCPVYFCAYDPRLPDRNKLLIRKYIPDPVYIAEVEAAAIGFLQEIETMFEILTTGE
jgi:predicted phage-related endonuclease